DHTEPAEEERRAVGHIGDRDGGARCDLVHRAAASSARDARAATCRPVAACVRLRYPGHMRAAREEVIAALVTGALAAPDLERAHVALLEPLKSAWRADRAFLVHVRMGGAPEIAAGIPKRADVALDPSTLAPALRAEVPAIIGPLPDGGTALALGLRERW